MKVGPSEPPQAPKKKKIKKVAHKPRSPTLSAHEGSQSHTLSEVPMQCCITNEEENDTAATSNPKVSETTTMNLEVIFEIPNFVPTTEEIFQDFSIPSRTSNISYPIIIAPCPPVSIGVSDM